MKLTVRQIPEPLLLFGSGVTHVDPRIGLEKGGLLSVRDRAAIKLGVVSVEAETAKITKWIKRLGGWMIDTADNALRFPKFPGSDRAVNARFEINETKHVREIPDEQFQTALARNPHERFDSLLDLSRISSRRERRELIHQDSRRPRRGRRRLVGHEQVRERTREGVQGDDNASGRGLVRRQKCRLPRSRRPLCRKEGQDTPHSGEERSGASQEGRTKATHRVGKELRRRRRGLALQGKRCHSEKKDTSRQPRGSAVKA